MATSTKVIALLIVVLGAFAAWLSTQQGEITRPVAVPTPARVVGVYPSGEQLPENTLRIHVRFSGPMERSDALQHVHVLDSQGRRIDRPFLELADPLWSPSGDVVTLLMHPGRVKSGLVANKALGRPLVAGARITVVVGTQMRDATGHALAVGYRQHYQIVPAEKRALDAAHWSVGVPAARTRDPATLSFAREMDALSLGSFVRIVDADDQVVAGEIKLGPAEKTWRFHPARPWPADKSLAIRVDRRLEDCAGNTLNGPFDAPATQHVTGASPYWTHPLVPRGM